MDYQIIKKNNWFLSSTFCDAFISFTFIAKGYNHCITELDINDLKLVCLFSALGGIKPYFGIHNVCNIYFWIKEIDKGIEILSLILRDQLINWYWCRVFISNFKRLTNNL